MTSATAIVPRNAASSHHVIAGSTPRVSWKTCQSWWYHRVLRTLVGLRVAACHGSGV